MTYRVVLVEDDPMVLSINRRYLEKDSRFEVSAAFRDGRSALEYLESNEADLLLLDIYMPVFTGLDLLKALRMRGIGIQVIMITAANDSGSLETALSLGIMDYLMKPFEYTRLKKALDTFIYQASVRKRLEKGPKMHQQDIDKAKELLAEAGYPDGFSFTIQVPSNYQPHIDTAQVLAEQLKAIGVNAEIQLIEWESWLSDVYAGRNFEATVVGLDASALTARAMLERFTSTSSKNFTNYSNEEYDEVYARAVASTDEDEQTKDYKECEKILTEDAANVYIQDMVSLVALNKKFAGYEFYPLYVQDMAKIYRVED